MLRAAGSLAVAVLLFASGCTMCCHPYDDCGPVYHGDSCSSHGRAGSILDGTAETASSLDVVENQQPTPAPRQAASYPVVSQTRSRGDARPPARLPAQSRSQASSRTRNQQYRTTDPQDFSAARSQQYSEARSQQYSQARRPRSSREQLAQNPRQSHSGTPTPAALRAQIQAETRPDDVPGSERIVSVTDRVVGEPASSGESAEVASDSGADAPTSLPAKGWTARHSAADVTR